MRSSSARPRSRRPGSRRARTSSTARSSSSAGRCTTPATSTVRSRPTRRAHASTRGWPGHDPERRRRAGLGARRRLVRGGRGRTRPRDPARARRRERSEHDARRALLRLGEPTLVSLAVGDIEAADGYARLAEEDAAQLPLRLPAAIAGRARAAVLLAAGEPLEAAGGARVGRGRRRGRSRLQAAFSRSLEGRALAAAGERSEAIAVLRRGRAGARRLRVRPRAGRDAP